MQKSCRPAQCLRKLEELQPLGPQAHLHRQQQRNLELYPKLVLELQAHALDSLAPLEKVATMVAAVALVATVARRQRCRGWLRRQLGGVGLGQVGKGIGQELPKEAEIKYSGPRYAQRIPQ